MARHNLRGILAQSIGLLVLCAAALVASFRTRLARLDEPLFYLSDGLNYAAIVKNVIEEGWYSGLNSRLGAPFGANTLDFPIAENANVLLIRVLAVFSHDWALVYNGFYVLTFFLVTLTAFWVMRDMGLRPAWAALGALLFAFLPYHFLRVGHLFLTNYSIVPLAVWLSLRAWDGGGPNSAATTAPRAWLTWPQAIVCAIVGFSGVYYAFFACLFLTLSLLAAAIRDRNWRGALPGGAMVAAVVLAVSLNAAPTIWFRIVAGPNPEGITRSPLESELYGLKITQLMMPSVNHVVDAARRLAVKYAQTAPLISENYTASLGILGSVGFVLALAFAFRRLIVRADTPSTRDRLAALNLVAVLFATVGGFGTVFAFLVAPQIRSVNRVSVYIAFFSLAVLMFVAQRLVEIWTSKRGRSAIFGLVLVAGVGLVGTIDQLLGHNDWGFAPVGIQSSDRDFVRRVEVIVPEATMILQLPYHPWPEGGKQESMEDYSHLIGYLHSSSLRWSYGGMKGRDGDRWHRALSRKPLEEQVRIAAQSGFGGIYVDRTGYADAGAAVEGTLRKLLGEPRVVSSNGRLAFYRLAATGNRPPLLEELQNAD